MTQKAVLEHSLGNFDSLLVHKMQQFLKLSMTVSGASFDSSRRNRRSEVRAP